MDVFLDEQLGRLKTDSIGFYLLYGLSEPFWENLSTLGVTDFLDDAVADGQIRYAGFSFHDTRKVLKDIVRSTTGRLPKSNTTLWTSATRQGQRA